MLKIYQIESQVTHKKSVLIWYEGKGNFSLKIMIIEMCSSCKKSFSRVFWLGKWCEENDEENEREKGKF